MLIMAEPIEIALSDNDMSKIPAHDSPHHILNALDNFCIQKVLRNLDNIEDFLSAAEVCMRFQENAKACFPLRYRTICANGWDGNAPYFIPLDRVGSFLNKFANFIPSINLDFSNEPNDSSISNIIPKFCNETLIELRVCARYVFKDQECVCECMRELGRVELSFAPSLAKYHSKSQLKQLAITVGTDYNWLAQAFPNLLDAKFNTFRSYNSGLNDDILSTFLSHNHQLQNLSVENCEHVTSFLLRRVADHVPNLVKLKFLSLNSYVQKADIIHLNRLQNLRSLEINVSEFLVRSLINSLADNCVPITELIIGNSKYDLSKTIPRLKLRRLDIHLVSEKSLVDIVKNTPYLEELTVQHPTDMTTTGIIQVLQYGINLKRFSMFIYFFTVDIKAYESMLAVAKGRTKVHLILCPSRINVPEHILNMHREWVDLSSYRTGFII